MSATTTLPPSSTLTSLPGTSQPSLPASVGKELPETKPDIKDEMGGKLDVKQEPDAIKLEPHLKQEPMETSTSNSELKTEGKQEGGKHTPMDGSSEVKQEVKLEPSDSDVKQEDSHSNAGIYAFVSVSSL